MIRLKVVDIPKYCPKCGIKLEGNNKLCLECGTNLLNKESTNKKEKTKTIQNKKEYTSILLENYFKKSVIIAIISIIFSIPIVVLFKFPIQVHYDYPYYVTVIQNFFIDLIFWSIIIFAIGIIISSWKNLKKHDIKIFIVSIIIALSFIFIVISLDLPLKPDEIKIKEYSGHTTSIFYYVNGTVENTGDVPLDADLAINLYDSNGNSLAWEYDTICDIPPHSTETFYYEFWNGDNNLESHFDVEYCTVVCIR